MTFNEQDFGNLRIEEMQKLISIIIPVYNVEKYLSDCLESVIQQTYKNLEIILIDDGSTDSSGRICDEYSKQDSRIVVIHTINSGVSDARNKGLSIAKGEYIGFVDADDTIDLSMYEKLLKEISENNCDIVFCNYTLRNEKTDESNELNLIRKGKCNNQYALWAMLVRPGYITAVWNKLYKRSSIFRDNEFVHFNTDITVGEDQLWLEEVLEKTNDIYLLNDPLYYWHVRINSASRTTGITKQRYDELYVAEDAVDKYSEINKELNRAVKVKLYLVASSLLRDIRNVKDKGNTNRIKSDVKKSYIYWLFYGEGPLFHRLKSIIGSLFRLACS